jgi:hypothetical protein
LRHSRICGLRQPTISRPVKCGVTSYERRSLFALFSSLVEALGMTPMVLAHPCSLLRRPGAAVSRLWPGIAIFASLASALYAQDIVGTWQGMLEIPNGPQGSPQRQTVLWKFERSITGLMVTSYSQDGSQPPIDGSLVVQGETVTVSLPSIGSKYEGELKSGGACIVGTFTQSTSLPLKLIRVNESTASPISYAVRPSTVTDCQTDRSGTKASAVAHGGIHWGPLLREWWLDIGIEQSERLIQEAKTRDQLNGKFFKEWFNDVAQYRYGLWNDGDKFFTSYLGHPLQGAVVEGIFWQNDDRVRFSEQDFHSAAYRKALLQAFAFATLDAVQWKLGPVSEASIGHVGLPAHWWDTPYYCNLYHEYCHPRTGLNDLVMNEVGGTVLMIGFQWTDKHLQVPIERRFHNRAIIDTTRILTNPPATLANLLRFRRPWFRDNRDGGNPHSTL